MTAPSYKAEDLTVIIPTRDRWDILQRTLDALHEQSAPGFTTCVVVDGTDQSPPALPDIRLLINERGGPGAARNRAAREAQTPLIVLLGDDTIPTPRFIEAHLDGHNAEPAPTTGVLGPIRWHPDVGSGRLNRWLDWSATQFNFLGLTAHEDAHWSRLYSSNVSLKRDFFLDAGGYDEDFTFAYECTDLGWRLGEHGLRLRWEPTALAHHLHPYTWDRVTARFDTIATGERLMARKHSEFKPFFKARAEYALHRRRVLPIWPLAVDWIPPSVGPARRFAERRATRWYYRRLAPRFLGVYEGSDGVDELRAYLGDHFDERRLHHHAEEVDREEHDTPDELTFYRTSEAYLYDLTVFALSGTKLPYHHAIERVVPRGARLLDYGCGIGSDGLRLIERGYDVAFTDFANPSTRYLQWRLARRGLEAPVYDVEGDVPGGFDAVYSFDVIEHVDDPFAFLARLESLADLVAVNFLEPVPDDTHLHKPLDIPALLYYAQRRGLLYYRVHHGRSHLVIYRAQPGKISAWQSAVARAKGRLVRRADALDDRIQHSALG